VDHRSTAPQRQPPHDVWWAGEAYDLYMGRWSRLIARDFVDWLRLPGGGRWLDVGCGTGALTQAILSHASPASVLAVDPSDQFIAHARGLTQDQRVSFESGDGQRLPFADRAFDAVVAGLVLNFVSDPGQTAAEMRRVLRPGGTGAVYVWDYAGEMQLIRHFWNAVVALDPDAHELDEGQRFPICKPEPLLALLRDCGFEQTQWHVLDLPTVFESFEDYWSPFLGGQGPAPSYCGALPENQRALLRKTVQAMLPVKPDGSIKLRARAFAVRGLRPS
jgi:SAM-dependent methyltransferase